MRWESRPKALSSSIEAILEEYDGDVHFELRVDERFTNPVKTLGDYVIPPNKTMTYLYNLKARRARHRFPG